MRLALRLQRSKPQVGSRWMVLWLTKMDDTMKEEEDKTELLDMMKEMTRRRMQAQRLLFRTT